MFDKLNLARKWRVVTTGLCFLTFVCGGLVLTLTALPCILLLSSTPAQREQRVLTLIHYAFKFFIRYMQVLNPIASFRVHGLEHVSAATGSLFIANHPTLIDVVAIISCLPDCQCLVKKSLLQNFWFGGLLRAASYVANDHAVQLIDDCARRLHAGHSLLIFPEGTRSPAAGLHPFTRGAAQIAIRTGAPIIPVVITCDPPTLLKGQPWYTVPPRPIDLRLRFLPPVEIPPAVTNKQGVPLQARALTRHLENLFRHELRVTKTADLGLLDGERYDPTRSEIDCGCSLS
jgi:1-acyl-sn-glycerol-3-phosphate acyltransferase